MQQPILKGMELCFANCSVRAFVSLFPEDLCVGFLRQWKIICAFTLRGNFDFLNFTKIEYIRLDNISFISRWCLSVVSIDGRA